MTITASEYAAVQGLTGMGAYGATAAQLATASTDSYGPVTWTQNFATQTGVPARTYPVALSVRTGGNVPTTMVGIKLKLSTTSQTGGYANWPASGAATPGPTSGVAAMTIYYFLLKQPTGATTATSNIAAYFPVFSQLGGYTSSGSVYYGTGDTATPSSAYNNASLFFQVLAIPTKQW